MEATESMLRKVRALLRQADHPNTSPVEADTFRAKAEALMFRYRIEEATMAAAQAGGDTTQPVWRDVIVCAYSNENALYYNSIFSSCVQHAGVRAGGGKGVVVDGEYVIVRSVVGFPSDVEIFESLYTSCMLAFAAKVEPKYDKYLSDQVNAYLMRSAGMEGWRIAQAIYGSDAKSLRVKVRKMFRLEAESRGEDPSALLGRGNIMNVYRESYATGFGNTIYSRLRTMRAARGEQEVGLVLANRSHRVNEAFYDRFPMYRPKSGSTAPYKVANDGCAKCAKAKSGYCREHSWMRPRAVRQSAFNNEAYARGGDAARAVDIGPTPKDTKISSSKMKEIE